MAIENVHCYLKKYLKSASYKEITNVGGDMAWKFVIPLFLATCKYIYLGFSF